MPSYLLHGPTYAALWPLLVLAAVTAALLFPVNRASKKGILPSLALLAFGLLGAVAGIVTGLSRESAVGAVLPAVLSFVGVLVLYMLGFEKGDAKLVSSCVIALTINLGTGIFWGSLLREEATRAGLQYLDDIAWQKQSYEYRKSLADLEAAVRHYRISLGLPPTESKDQKDAEPDAKPKEDAKKKK